MFLLGRLSIAGRLLLVLAIGLLCAALMALGSLRYLRSSLENDRVAELRHLLDTAFSIVAHYHAEASTGHMSERDAKQAAARAVRTMRFDGSNYFFIWDFDGLCIANPGQPAFEGRNYRDSPVVKQLIALARTPPYEGMTTYEIPRGGETEPVRKMAYARRFAPWSWSIGAGAYLDDIEQTYAERARSIIWEAAGLIAVASLITLYLARDLARAIRQVSSRLESVTRGNLDVEIPCTDRRDEVGAVARALVALRDTSREAAELRLDQLTRLPTRTVLMDRLRRSIKLSERRDCYGAIMLIDMDNFKTLNDAHGHDYGDRLLREVAQRLTRTVRENDTVGRLGGDEFIVIFDDIGNLSPAASTNARVVAEKIIAVLEAPYVLGHVTHRSSASLGIALFHGTSVPADGLLKQADLAMYRSKHSGAGTYSFYDSHMEAARRDRAFLAQDLQRALNESSFVLHFQPQVDIDGVVIGAEALIRWEHPGRGMVPPAHFMPIAEEIGLIAPIGQWVLDAACARLASWSRQPETAELCLAVNISPRELSHPEFVAHVTRAIEAAGAEPTRLVLEMTETAFVHNFEGVAAKVTRLRDLGVRFALDDFGTGYSSLELASRVAFDQLKIDRTFVGRLPGSAPDHAIATLIVALADALHLEVVAEGVENAAQLRALRQLGCRLYQGFLFGRPEPIEAFERNLRVLRLRSSHEATIR